MENLFKKIASIAMACIFVFSCTVSANAELFSYYDIPYVNYKTLLSDSEPWDGGISDGIEGDGSAENPYLITNANDLAWVAYQTHEKGSEFAGKNFKITHNIDFGNKTRWLPIGTQEHPFRGTIEGNGAVFKNLHVEDHNGADVSIFGNICDANVSDITIADTVRLTSVGREPLKFERKLRYIGHDIVSVSNLYDSEHGEYDRYINVWVNNNVTINASGNPKDNYKKIAVFPNDIEQKKDFFVYQIWSCTVVDNKDESDFLAMNSENELKYIKMEVDGGDGGNVGIFRNVAGNSTISGINNHATLESFGGTVDYSSFTEYSPYGMYIKVVENLDGSKTVSYGYGNGPSEGYVPWGSDALSLPEYQEALKQFKGDDSVTEEETLRTIRDNKKYMEHWGRNRAEDNKGNEYIILGEIKPDICNCKAGDGGSVGMISTTSSKNNKKARNNGGETVNNKKARDNGGETVFLTNCKNFGGASSTGGGVLTQPSQKGCITAGNGGSAGGGIGNSNSNVVVNNFENRARVSANGGGVNQNSAVNIGGIFESLAGKGGSAGGCLGTADDPSASDSVAAQSNDTDQSDDTYRVVFKGKNVNTGKIEAISGENSGNCSGGNSAGGPLSKGSAGRRVSGLCNGENGDGGCAAGFVAESYLPIIFSEGSENINTGDCNANGIEIVIAAVLSSGTTTPKEELYNVNVHAGTGGWAAGGVAFAAEPITIGGEVENEGNISANGGAVEGNAAEGVITKNGNAGTAGGIGAVLKKDVKMADSGKASNCGKVEAIGRAPSSEHAVAGIGGTAGAAFGDVGGNVAVTNFTNEESGTVDASGQTDGDKAGSAGILGRARGDTRLVGVINRAAFRSAGNDNGFSGGHASFTGDCDGNITIINSQDMGDKNADGGGTAAIVPRVLPGKKLEISNFGSTGNTSAIDGTGGIILANSGEASLTNTYFSGNVMANHWIRLTDIPHLHVRYVYSDKEDAAGVQSILHDPKEFARQLNSNAIEINKGRNKADPYLCGWVLGHRYDKGIVMVCPEECPDVAIEIFSFEDKHSDVNELIEKYSYHSDGVAAQANGDPGSTPDNPILIDDIRNLPCGDQSAGKYYKYTGTTIDLPYVKEYSVWKYKFSGLGSEDNPFRGHFDGNGAVVSSLHVSLFNCVEGAEISNLVFDRSCVLQEITANYRNIYPHGLIAVARGSNTFRNIITYATILGQGENFDVGGIVGNAVEAEDDDENKIVFINCENHGDVCTIGGEGTSAGSAGGLLGDSNGCSVIIINCKNEGKVTSCSIGAKISDVDDVFGDGRGKAGNAGGFGGSATADQMTIAGNCINTGKITASSLFFNNTTGFGCTFGTGLSSGSSAEGSDGGNAGAFWGYFEGGRVLIPKGSNCKSFGEVDASGFISGSTGLARGANDNIFGGNGGNAGLFGVLIVGIFCNFGTLENNRAVLANGGDALIHGNGGNGGNAGGVIGALKGNARSTYRSENNALISANGGNGSSPRFEEKIYKITDERGQHVQANVAVKVVYEDQLDEYDNPIGRFENKRMYLWQKDNIIGYGESPDDPSKVEWKYVIFRGSLVNRDCLHDDSFKEEVWNGNVLQKIEWPHIINYNGGAFPTMAVDGREIFIDSDGKLKQRNIFARNCGRGKIQFTGNAIKPGGNNFTAFSEAAYDEENKPVVITDDGYKIYGNLNDSKHHIALIKNPEGVEIPDLPRAVFSKKEDIYNGKCVVIYTYGGYYSASNVGLMGSPVDINKDYYFIHTDGNVYRLNATFKNGTNDGDGYKITLKNESGNQLGYIEGSGSRWSRDIINNGQGKDILLSINGVKFLNENIEEARQNVGKGFPQAFNSDIYSPKYCESAREGESNKRYFVYKSTPLYFYVENSEDKALSKITIKNADTDALAIEIVYPQIGLDGEIYGFKLGDSRVRYNGVPIKLGAKSQTLEYDDDGSNNETYSKKLFKVNKSEGPGGNGGDGGSAGAFAGKCIKGTVEISNFKNSSNAIITANAGLKGTSNNEDLAESAEDGAGGSVGFAVGAAEGVNIEIKNLQCMGNAGHASGQKGKVGIIGKIDETSSLNITNSFLTGSATSDGHAGVAAGEGLGPIKVNNFFCACDVNAPNEGEPSNTNSAELKDAYFSNKYFSQDNIPILGNMLVNSGYPGVYWTPDENMRSLKFVSGFNKRAKAYNLALQNANSRLSQMGLDYDPSLGKGGPDEEYETEESELTGWIRPDEDSYPYLSNNDIDPVKMVRNKAPIPVLDYRTDTSIKIEDRTGQEFSRDSNGYTDQILFEDLKSLDTHNVHAREVGGFNIEPGESSDPLVVRTIPTRVFERIGKAREWINDLTGIQFIFSRGAFPDGATMYVREVDKNHANYATCKKNTDDLHKIEKIKYYEIKMLDKNGNEIQPKGYYAMLIPVPEDFDLTENDLTGFCIKTEQDELHDTDNDIIYIDGIPYYMIVSNHFSDWAIADLDDDQAEAEEAKEATVEDRLKSAATSDNHEMHCAWLSFLISSALLACFTFMKKRNYKK